MLKYLHQVPALPAAVGLVAGILVWWIGGGATWAVVAAVVGVALWLVKVHYAAVALYSLAIGWALAMLNAPSPMPTGLDELSGAECAGEIVDVSINRHTTAYIVGVDSLFGQPVDAFRAYASTAYDPMPLAVGSRVRFKANFSPAEVRLDLPGQPDLTQFYAANRISALARVDDESLVVTGREKSLVAVCDDAARSAMELLVRSGLSDNAYGLEAALLLGRADELPESMLEGFRATGVAHALALSGFHVGFVVLLLNLLLLPMRVDYRLYRWRICLIVINLWIYAWAVGLPMSVVRAVIMYTVYCLGRLTGRQVNSLNSLCVAVIIILAMDPMGIFSIGLQMSVAAVLGIIAFVPIINRVNPRRKYLYALAGWGSVIVAALLGTMLLSAFYFHRLPVLFMLSNAVVSLLMPVWMFGGAALMLLEAFGIHLQWLTDVINASVSVTDYVVTAIGNLSWSQLSNLYVPAGVVASIALMVITGAVAIHLNNCRGFIALGAAVVAVVVSVICCRMDVSQNEVRVLRSGFATAVIVKHGNVADVYTACPRPEQSSLAAKLGSDIAPYASITGIDTLHYIDRQIFEVGVKSVAFASAVARGDTTAVNVNYLVLGRRSRGDIGRMLRHYRPDTLVIGADASPRMRGIGRLEAAIEGIATIDLRTDAWHL